MKKHFKTMILLALIVVCGCLMAAETATACSMAGATGDSTVDGRPVIWKNRDAWGTTNAWKVFPYQHIADSDTFGAGDRYTDRFDFIGVTDEDWIDPITQEQIPWAGANEAGLALASTAAHTLTADFQSDNGYTPDMDEDGMDNGQLNLVILSRCEHIDQVEQVLRDTNNGGGFNGSTARNTSTIIMVFDRHGNMATFEVSGSDFTRDNVTQEYARVPYDGGYIYPQTHDDDKNSANPVNGAYSGFDWRSNFSRVDYTRTDGFPFFVDDHYTEVINNQVVNTDQISDGVHDWETSTSTVKRWGRIGSRMDDPLFKDYQYFIQKNVGDDGIPDDEAIESLSRFIGTLPGTGGRSTGYHLNRFVTTFSVVIRGAVDGDPYDGKLTTMWLALGEPAVTIFIPLFPYSNQVPSYLNTMYEASNKKRKLVYDYDDDDSGDYSDGRNVDHSIDLVALTGEDYYGEDGLQYWIFQNEYWAYDQYENFLNNLPNNLSDASLRYRLRSWQRKKACHLKWAYTHNRSVILPPNMMDPCPATPAY